MFGGGYIEEKDWQIKAIVSLPQALQGSRHASLVPTQLWHLLKIKNVKQNAAYKMCY
ncbi:MAG: hypothetical protein ACTS7E_04105 [Arsenophonus sp. NC-CH8-MAG3]